MPTYEYVCTACGNAWEETQKITANALTDCPKCNQATAKRQVSGGSFILKGGGWYADLYSSAKPAAASGATGGGGASGSDGGKGSGGSESASSAPKEAAPAKTETAAPAAPATTTPKSST